MSRIALCLLIASLLTTSLPLPGNGAEGVLDAMRNDVGGNVVASLASTVIEHAGRSTNHGDDGVSFSAWFSSGAITAPLWIPINMTNDDMQFDCYFQRYPYHRTRGSIVRPYDLPGGTVDYEALAAPYCTGSQAMYDRLFPPRIRRWSGRFSADYGSEFNDLERITGRLVFNTASRFGLDTEMSYVQEPLPDGTHDHLWLGDGNLVFRFAQSDWSEWRIGLGMNWLDDRQQTDYGFNFTYGVDLYVHRPWITSLDIDWGTLGNTGLFRLRTTTGVVFWGLETYVGYEYLDIGRTQTNSLLGGVRFWF